MLKQNFQKNKVDTGKTVFFVIGPFCIPILFVLTFVLSVTYVTLSIVVLSTTKLLNY